MIPEPLVTHSAHSHCVSLISRLQSEQIRVKSIDVYSWNTYVNTTQRQAMIEAKQKLPDVFSFCAKIFIYLIETMRRLLE